MRKATPTRRPSPSAASPSAARPSAACPSARPLRTPSARPGRARALAAAACVAALALLALPAPAQAGATLRITEVLPDPATDGREFVEVWNPGSAPVELAGWQLKDQPTASGTTATFTFPAWTLPPNGRVVVWGGGTADALGPAWSAATAWNNAGDAVHLLAPDGTLVDWAAYATAPAPPAGFESAPTAPRPGKGLSAQLGDAGWSVQEPTPGTVPGATAGQITLEVANAAPTVQVGALPRSVRPGATLRIPLAMADPNGDADLAAWSLTLAGAPAASGTSAATEATVTAPAAPGSVQVTVAVTDRAGATATAHANLTVRWSDLQVALPPGGTLRLPAAAPGATVAVAEPMSLRNDGEAPTVPRVDVSPFRGPAAIAPEGRLWIAATVGGATTWVAYAGPLTPLPPLDPGAEMTVAFELRGLPAVPAGSYGTSFTVVASP